MPWAAAAGQLARCQYATIRCWATINHIAAPLGQPQPAGLAGWLAGAGRAGAGAGP